MKNLELNCLSLIYGGLGTCKCYPKTSGGLNNVNVFMSPKSYPTDNAKDCNEQCCDKLKGIEKWIFSARGYPDAEGKCIDESSDTAISASGTTWNFS